MGPGRFFGRRWSVVNYFLWSLQIILALHTAIGAFWKLSNSEQSVTSLRAIPHELWLALSLFELLCSLGLTLPIIDRRRSSLVPAAATVIGIEMLFFTGVHLYSGDANIGPIVYWLFVAAICAFLAYGRSILKPLGRTSE